MPAAGDLIYVARMPLFIRKTSSETINNSATLQDDDELVLAVEASGVYEVVANIIYQSGTTADIKFAFTFPSGSMSWFARGLALAATTFTGDLAANAWNAGGSGSAISLGGAGTTEVVGARLSGLLVVGATGGNLRLQWAQNTADASNTIVRPASYLRLTQVE